MREKTLKILEYEKILDRAARFCRADLSRSFMKSLRPSEEINEVKLLQDETREAYLIENKYLCKPIIAFDDCSESVKKATIGINLSIAELLKILRLLKASENAKTEIARTGEDIKLLKYIISGLYSDTRLAKRISDSVLDENTLSDNASPTLREIRKKIARQKSALNEKLNSYTKNNSSSKFLQDNIVTIRNGRYVLPVKNECRNSVPGLIHDQSASGGTVFIEPYAVVELNNAVKVSEAEELAEIERILAEFTAEIAKLEKELRLNQESLIKLDVIFAKTEYSVSIGATEPEINDDGILLLNQARHPLIDKDKIVPVDFSLGGENRIMVISGANTAGKTVCMKTVGLLCAIAYSGFKIPCGEGSKIAFFDDIFCDIGDNQSITDSLSTFSARITNIIDITENLTDKSLVLLDEPGSGTDPDEGAALAIGIIKFLELNRTEAIISTHFGAIKEYAMGTDGIINACMQFDEMTLKPTYKLLIGLPGNSNALSISKNLGLNDFILNVSYANLSTQKQDFDKILLNTAKIREEAETEKERLMTVRTQLETEKNALKTETQKLNKKLNELNENSKTEIRKLVRSAAEEADELLDIIKRETEKGTEASILDAKRARNKLWELSYKAEITSDTPNLKIIDPVDIIEGKRVFVIKTGLEGVIKQVKKNEVAVQIGAMILKVKPNELAYPIEKQENKQQINHSGNISVVSDLPKELKVMGMTVSEAIELIEPEIQSLHLFNGNKTLKIVHGKGTGSLARGIHEFLKNNKSIESFRYGKYGEGDTGVTLVTVR